MSLLDCINKAQPRLKTLLQSREKEQQEAKKARLQPTDELNTTTTQQTAEPTAEKSKGSAPPQQSIAATVPTNTNNDPKESASIVPSVTLPSSFYSSKRIKHIEERILHFFANVRRRLDGSQQQNNPAPPLKKAHWETFPTQQAAFDYADRYDPTAQELRIFSVEYNEAGKRKFLVASYSTFWHRYRDMLPLHRHYYEIIRQGFPCHLYLDLEYNVQSNPEKDGTAAVDATLSLLRDAFKTKFALELQDDWVLELDSSSDSKFSRHIIVRLPERCFKNNAHVGAFVFEVCKRIREEREKDERCDQLIVKKGDKGEETLFIDTGVYSRNRAFRLYLSSKAGKSTHLLPTDRFLTSKSNNKTQEEVFLDSLVCNVPRGCKVLQCLDESIENGSGGYCIGKGGSNHAQQGGRYSSTLGGTGSAHLSYGPSPFPLLDTFIESVCNQGGTVGRIRSWASLDATSSLMLYNISGNRYCTNINREHRSNGIFLVVDLEQGAWWQKCYDPDCRQYRSPAMPLPQELMALRHQHMQQQQQQQQGAGEENQQGEDAGDTVVEQEEQMHEQGSMDCCWGIDDNELAAVQQVEELYWANKFLEQSL